MVNTVHFSFLSMYKTNLRTRCTGMNKLLFFKYFVISKSLLLKFLHLTIVYNCLHMFSLLNTCLNKEGGLL